ncbi:hypothetical protein [Mycolicibacterium sp. 050158]|jgi:hypothetical protein|nr:hypothetical protein [Mycolicibacterium sp. 050158]MDX1889958.1 hypothetical protein [Mycolicibacterium sp. 050158]
MLDVVMIAALVLGGLAVAVFLGILVIDLALFLKLRSSIPQDPLRVTDA